MRSNTGVPGTPLLKPQASPFGHKLITLLADNSGHTSLLGVLPLVQVCQCCQHYTQ